MTWCCNAPRLAQQSLRIAVIRQSTSSSNRVMHKATHAIQRSMTLQSCKSKLPDPADPAERFLELSPGRSVSITDAGSGEHGVLVALHGTPGSVFDFRYLGGELERSGCRVIRVNFPGHGRTPANAIGEHGDPADGQALAKLVLEICDTLELDRPVLLAHSLGSQVAMNCGVLAPQRLGGLALLNPVPCFTAHRMIRPYWFVRLSSSVHGMFDASPLHTPWRMLLRLSWIAWGFTRRVTEEEVAHGQRRLLFVDFEHQQQRSAALKQSRIPTLMCWATNDPMIEPELLHQLSQSLPAGPRLVFGTGGHFINKHHAEPIATAILDFIALAHMNREAAGADSSREAPPRDGAPSVEGPRAHVVDA